MKTLISNRILVGHALVSDLSVLKLEHPPHARRDTSLYPPFREKYCKGDAPALRKVTLGELGVAIQYGEHDSVEDAQAAMALYRHVHKDFETLWRSKHNVQEIADIAEMKTTESGEEAKEQEITHAALEIVSTTTVVEEVTPPAEVKIPKPLSAEKERKIQNMMKRRKLN